MVGTVGPDFGPTVANPRSQSTIRSTCAIALAGAVCGLSNTCAVFSSVSLQKAYVSLRLPSLFDVVSLGLLNFLRVTSKRRYNEAIEEFIKMYKSYHRYIVPDWQCPLGIEVAGRHPRAHINK